MAISLLSLAISDWFFWFSSSAFLIYFCIMSLSLIKFRISVFSASVYFLKYSISLVRAFTPYLVTFFSASESFFYLVILSLSLVNLTFSILNSFFCFSTSLSLFLYSSILTLHSLSSLMSLFF
jgi:hypothetical protein